jgi:hypothetical protein
MEKKTNPLRELNAEFEDDLKLGGLMRTYNRLGKELLSVAAEMSKLGFTVPNVETKTQMLSVIDMDDDY